jgi:nicotinate-nucleotide adenylyltransferase
MIRTGIFGGSFNPIHNGHISLAKQLKEKAGLDEVWLMVSPQNPLKQAADLLDDTLRMEMARLALDGVDSIIASDYEMHLPKPSYTWNTLQALSKDYPDREFVLLMGGDNWEHFDRWYHYEDIKRSYEVAVYTRTPGEAGYIDISSTDIRQRIKAGKGIRRLVPKAVADYIKEKGLYKGEKVKR